ncbi:MAG: 2-oxoacid:acceptor oxidoreductase family protein [Candidatus Buchananbacteria bacterium]
MIEIRIHGRGGQGVVTFAELLAEAAYLSGYQAQAFPAFGVERRGAPIRSFVRLDQKVITLRSQVYQPDYLIILDDTLLLDKSIKLGLKTNGKVFINTSQAINQPRQICFDASGLSQKIMGKPFANVATLAIFASQTKLIKLAAVLQVIKNHFASEVAAKNILVANLAFQSSKKV